MDECMAEVQSPGRTEEMSLTDRKKTVGMMGGMGGFTEEVALEISLKT